MKKKLVTLALMAAFSFIALPVGGSEANAQRRWNGDRSRYGCTYQRQRRSNDRRWRDRRSYNDRRQTRRLYRYRNYGQYRRSYVGSRRARYVPRYYWSNGYRRVRYVRVW